MRSETNSPLEDIANIKDIVVDYSKIDDKVEKIIKLATSYMGDLDENYIRKHIIKAYELAKEAHHGQFRKSGEPYISHPVESAMISLSIKPDLVTIESCLLHDVIEDTDYTYEDIKAMFGADVAHVCEGVEKVSKVKYRGEERNVGSLRKMFLAMAEDIRVIFVKLSDRLHNMRTLKHHSNKEKRDRIALETLNIYIPIADRLGLFGIKNALEEECFKVLEPNEYKKIKQELAELKVGEVEFRKNAKQEIGDLLKRYGIKYEIDFRVKSIYSIYMKMKNKGFESVKDLYDIFGIRIIVDDVETCYRTLGVIHSNWTPIPKKFKDYIALPKPNGYKSLHTTIIGLIKNYRQQATEIQIRTRAMHLQAEIGIAAHFEYKENGSIIATDIDWVKELKDAVENLGNSDFMDSMNIDVFRDRIFLLTPKGDSIDMPSKSTPIDFAYELHSDLGNHIMLAKVNGKAVTLDKELHNGDVVEIITDKTRKANPLRLSFVRTTKARNAIKSFLKKENKDLHRDRGKEILNKYLERAGLDTLDKELSLLKTIDGKEYSLEERYSILEQLGNFSQTPANLVRRIIKVRKKSETKDKLGNITVSEVFDVSKVIVGGEKDVPYIISHCCEPKSGDKIVAHINRKGIISIHKRDCKAVSKLSRERLISAYFEGEQEENIVVKIHFVFANKIGVLKSLSEVLFSMNVNVIEMNSGKSGYEEAFIDITAEFPDYDYLLVDRFIDRIKFKMTDTLKHVEIRKIEN
ncbi:MAG: RelA/SpoT family protein [Candidatus Gracilibacteria bacterium]|nr:RelA/SpoT family protein [Candidatus Gracilibacteria bacterium]